MLAKPLFCTLFLALPLSVGCISEFHDGCDDDDFEFEDPNPNNNGGNNNGGNNNGGGCPDPATSIYLGTTRAVCDAITFQCPENYSAFNASCGCGCEEIDAPFCPTEDGEGITVLSRDLKVCGSITFTCPEGAEAFNGTCGCGCFADTSTTPTCPDRNAANVHYLGDPGTPQCTMVLFQCPAECTQFNNECGCGCIEPS